MARPTFLSLLLAVIACLPGLAGDVVTGQSMFENVDSSIQEKIPPLLRQGLDEVIVETGVTFAERKSGPLKLDIYRQKPKETADPGSRLLPAVVVIHGGSWKSGDRRQLGLYAASLARRGYIAYAVEYRLAPKHPWPAQWEDVRDAVIWLKKEARNQGVDPQRIGAVGYSAGGHLASMLATVGHQAFEPGSPELNAGVKCVAAGGAPCDFADMPPENGFLKYWLGATRKDDPDVYVQASPLRRVTAASAPIFFYNGTLDLIVRPNSARVLSEKLVRLGIDSAVHLIPGAGHISAALDEKALETAWAFLDKHLKRPGPAVDDSNPAAAVNSPNETRP